jgi:hypothetical protein
MHTHPDNPDDLGDLERRLSGWQPGAEGLDADAMLFAAGVAAGKAGRGRIVWPALCGVLAILAAGLTTWALVERAERATLAELLRQRPEPPGTSPPALSPLPESSPEGYLALRQRLDRETATWLAPPEVPDPPAPGPPPPEPAILRAGQRDAYFAP